jgi:hypothetical protein
MEIIYPEIVATPAQELEEESKEEMWRRLVREAEADARAASTDKRGQP